MKKEWKSMEQYYRSKTWEIRRKNLLRLRYMTCERCGCLGTFSTLQAHHKNYDNLYNETDLDLMCVCIPCHKILDDERKQDNANASYWRMKNAAFETYMEKKYGSSIWGCPLTEDAAWTEFENWLDRKEMDGEYY